MTMRTRTKSNHSSIPVNRVTQEELARIIKEHDLHQLLISAESGSFKGYPHVWKIGPLNYWDGTIINPNETHFEFGFIYRGGMDVITLQYNRVKGLLLPIVSDGKPVGAENYVLRN
jgi:hypothetical protein